MERLLREERRNKKPNHAPVMTRTISKYRACLSLYIVSIWCCSTVLIWMCFMNVVAFKRKPKPNQFFLFCILLLCIMYTHNKHPPPPFDFDLDDFPSSVLFCSVHCVIFIITTFILYYTVASEPITKRWK